MTWPCPLAVRDSAQRTRQAAQWEPAGTGRPRPRASSRSCCGLPAGRDALVLFQAAFSGLSGRSRYVGTRQAAKNYTTKSVAYQRARVLGPHVGTPCPQEAYAPTTRPGPRGGARGQWTSETADTAHVGCAGGSHSRSGSQREVPPSPATSLNLPSGHLSGPSLNHRWRI